MIKCLSFFLLNFVIISTMGQGCFPLVLGNNKYGPGVSLQNCHNNVYDPVFNAPSGFLDNNTRSVFMMEVQESTDPFSDVSRCSCTLLRQAFTSGDDNQQENIFITARHCIVKKAINPSNANANLMNVAGAKFIFNYSNPDGSTTSNINCKVGRYVIEGGADIIDISFINDIAILKLKQPIPPHFQPFYSGWSANQQVFSSGYFDIHHPSGDIKKISQTFPPFIQELIIPLPRYTVQWVHGRTQQGSSGSGLYNTNKRLFGVLSGAIFGIINENCFNTQTANFGKFKNLWQGSPFTRFFLNPNGINFLMGSPGGQIECYKGDLNLNGKYWPAGDYQPNNIITIKCEGNMFLAQPGGSTNNLTVYPGAEFNFEAGGQIIKAQPGFYAMWGSTVSIKPNMACTPMRMMNSIDPSDIDSNSVNYYYDESKGELPKEGMYSAKPVSTLQIFPNPNKGVFKVKSLGYKTEPHTFELIDVNGRIIYSVSSNYFDNGEEESFSFTDLPGGVYMLKIENEVSKNAEYKRVIIQK